MLVSLSVRDVMVTEVLTVGPDATAGDAAERLSENDVGSLVVCDGREPVGILTESDVVDLFAARADPDATAVREFMSADLVVAGPDASIERAAELLAEHDIRRLPVVEGDRIVGIVTVTDLSYYLPHLARYRRSVADLERTHPTGDSTAYEATDWEFDAHGVDDGLSVGDCIAFSKTLSAADVEAFAEATGDTNRVHLDDAFATRTRFGGRIAHGILTAGVISAALARIPGLTIYLSQDLSFLGPVEMGEEVRAVCEVIDDLGGDRYRLATRVYGADDELVLDGEAVVLVDAMPDEGDLESESELSAQD